MADTPNATPTNYNSAYTGPQIDAAVGAVLDKEGYWDAAAAGKLPTGGEVGQVLEKTGAEDNAAEWRTPPFLVRPNLLDNWYFVGGGSQLGNGIFPINQRGQQSYSLGANDVGIDRWIFTRSSSSSDPLNVVIGGESISLSKTTTGNARFIQKASNFWAAGTYTVSILVKSVTIPDGSSNPYICLLDPDKYIITGSRVYITGAGLFTATFNLPNVAERYKYSNTFAVIITSGVSVEITAVKLELGDTQTLAHQEGGEWVLNELPNWFEELRLCQRYLQWIPAPYGSYTAPIGSGICWNTTSARIALPLAVPMVGTPTVMVFGAAVLYKSDGSAAITPTEITALANDDSNGNLRNILGLNCAIEGGTNRMQIVLAINASGVHPAGLLLSCEN